MVGGRRLKRFETGATRVSARAEDAARLAVRFRVGKMTLGGGGDMNSGVNARQAPRFRCKTGMSNEKNDPVPGWRCSCSLNLRIQVQTLTARNLMKS